MAHRYKLDCVTACNSVAVGWNLVIFTRNISCLNKCVLNVRLCYCYNFFRFTDFNCNTLTTLDNNIFIILNRLFCWNINLIGIRNIHAMFFKSTLNAFTSCLYSFCFICSRKFVYFRNCDFLRRCAVYTTEYYRHHCHKRNNCNRTSSVFCFQFCFFLFFAFFTQIHYHFLFCHLLCSHKS